MTPGLVMAIGAIVFVVASLLAVDNFFRMAKSPHDMLENSGRRVKAHIILGLLISVSGTVSLAGFVWFLVERLAAR